MLKAVFRPNELVALPDKIVIESPTSYPDLAHFKQVEEAAEDIESVEEFTGPTADDLRHEAEIFKIRWEDEKEKMFQSAREEADNIIQDAQKTAFAEVRRQTDESLIIKQQAEDEAERVITEAKNKASDIENEIRQSLEGERKDARDSGREEGREEGFSDGKAEVDRLIERTQAVLERAQDKRGEILAETEKEIVDLVLLIARKVVKVISQNQRNVIVSNVTEALRKVRAKGDIIIRVNLADLKLATEHKQEFIKLMEGAKSVHVVEDSTVDKGGCIIETDFGEVDARVASQLAEMENKIMEISPMKSSIKDNTPMPVIRTANLNADLAASSSYLGGQGPSPASDSLSEPDSGSGLSSGFNFGSDVSPDFGSEDGELGTGASAALTASAALAALATMATKGKRDADKKIVESMESFKKRKTD